MPDVAGAPPFETLCALIRSVVKLDASVPIAPGASLVEDLGVDSLDLVSLLLEVQDAFGVVIDEEDLSGIVTVGDLSDYVQGQKASQAA